MWCFGSGSKSPLRDVVYRIDISDPSNPKKVDIFIIEGERRNSQVGREIMKTGERGERWRMREEGRRGGGGRGRKGGSPFPPSSSPPPPPTTTTTLVSPPLFHRFICFLYIRPVHSRSEMCRLYLCTTLSVPSPMLSVVRSSTSKVYHNCSLSSPSLHLPLFFSSSSSFSSPSSSCLFLFSDFCLAFSFVVSSHIPYPHIVIFLLPFLFLPFSFSHMPISRSDGSRRQFPPFPERKPLWNKSNP